MKPASGTLGGQVAQLARRSVLRTLRQPAQVVPTIVFPLFLLAVNSAGLEAATLLPGFPSLLRGLRHGLRLHAGGPSSR